MYSNTFIIRYAIATLLIVIYTKCATSNQTTPNYSALYGQSATRGINPSYILYHNSKSSTELHFRYDSDRVLYARKDKSHPFQSKVAIHYRVYNEGYNNARNLLDSATYYTEDVTELKEKKIIIGMVPIKLDMGKNYRIYIQLKDINKNAIHETFVNINKTDLADRYFFMLIDETTGKPHFDNFHTQDVKLCLKSELNASKKLYANYYQRDFPIAPPPFGSVNNTPFQYQPDVALQYELDDEGKHCFDMHNRGFVHFLIDSSSKNGFTLYRYDKNFPIIKNAYGMVDPLKFICTKTEFEALTTAENPKLALDKFWLDRSGTKERAREIIKIYYSRVQDANAMFTSYTEGWKTDRGMISLIFGIPKTIRKDYNQEVWIYGEESNIMSLQFIFSKVSNPFTSDDYKLQRSINYKTNWYRAVDAWRSGRVYWAQ